MTPIQPSSVIAQIMNELAGAEERRLNNLLAELNTQNKKLKGATFDGFLYRGAFYFPKDRSVVMPGYTQSKTMLDSSLETQMDRYISDKSAVVGELSIIRQMLHRLLAPCRYVEEGRSALPECFIALVPGWSEYSRTDEPAFTLRDNPRAYQQYKKLEPKMELYSAVRLFY